MRERSLSMAGLERIPRVALAGSEMSITRTLSGAGCARGRQRNVRGRARRVVLRSGPLRGRSGRNRRHDQAARRTRRGGPRRHSGTGHHWPLLPPFGRGPLPPRRSRRCRSCDRESSRDVVPVNACAAVRVSPLWQALNDCVRTGRAKCGGTGAEAAGNRHPVHRRSTSWGEDDDRGLLRPNGRAARSQGRGGRVSGRSRRGPAGWRSPSCSTSGSWCLASWAPSSGPSIRGPIPAVSSSRAR